ncbi:uncharacterized protein LOC106362679 [Brassica napus]|uniref:uncharacterized protein LOC106362679 n=1 Tax=Brassica napus TaxID=3708 RepID=UPI00207863BE|nr:uncharacterized protein LOC106362679 [Brassica napus]
MGECNAVHVPVDPGLKLSRSPKEEAVNHKEFQRNIGCLQYLIHTRLDLAQNKRSSHYLRVKRSSWQLQRQQNKLSGCKIYLKISRKESQKKAVIRIDKKSAIALTKNPVFHGRSKHIRSRFHFIRECFEDGLVT